MCSRYLTVALVDLFTLHCQSPPHQDSRLNFNPPPKETPSPDPLHPLPPERIGTKYWVEAPHSAPSDVGTALLGCRTRKWNRIWYIHDYEYFPAQINLFQSKFTKVCFCKADLFDKFLCGGHRKTIWPSWLRPCMKRFNWPTKNFYKMDKVHFDFLISLNWCFYASKKAQGSKV